MSWKSVFVLAAFLCIVWTSTSLAAPGDDEKTEPKKEDKKEDKPALASYIGGKKCKICHMKEHKTWNKMKHSDAWDVLTEEFRKPDAKDDDGSACISCHVTGYGKPDQGGFVDAKTSKHLLGVQCEACHGPGSLHKAAVKGMEATKGPDGKKKKRFKPGQETHIVLATTACADCHNPHKNHKKFAKEDEAEKDATKKDTPKKK